MSFLPCILHYIWSKALRWVDFVLKMNSTSLVLAIWYHSPVVPQLICINITSLISVLRKYTCRIILIKVHLLAPNSSNVHFWHPNSKTIRFATSNYEILLFFTLRWFCQWYWLMWMPCVHRSTALPFPCHSVSVIDLLDQCFFHFWHFLWKLFIWMVEFVLDCFLLQCLFYLW